MDSLELEDLLKRAAKAHHEYESNIGHADEDWAAWYAQWITKETAFSPVSAASAQSRSWIADAFAGSFEG